MAREILEFNIPTWAVCSLINGDDSGLESEDIEKIEKFVADTVKKYGHAHFSLPSEDQLEPSFCWSNDIDNFGSDCITLLLLINENN